MKQRVDDANLASKTLASLEQSRVYMTQVVQDPKLVDLECLNQHELCTFWAVLGECEKNPAFMKLQVRFT